MQTTPALAKFFNGYLLVALYVLFVAPATIYYYNDGEFETTLIYYYQTAIIIAVLFLLCAYVAIKFLPTSLSKWLNTLCICLGIYIFIVNFIFPIDIGLLDGTNEKMMVLFTKDSIIQLIIYSLFLIIVALLVVIWPRISSILVETAFIIGIIWIIYVPLMYTKNSEVVIPEDNQQLLENFYSLSNNKNILVIGFDALQGNFIEEVLEENPAYKQLFDGFTYFSDTISISPTSLLSIASTLEGKIPSPIQNKDYKENAKRVSENNFVNDARLANFKTSVFPSMVNLCKLAPNDNCFTIAHDVTKKHILKINTEDSLLKLSLIRYIPSDLLQLIDKEIYNIFKPNTKDTIKAIMRDKSSNIVGFSYLTYKSLIDKLSVKTSSPVIKFQHYIFTHVPITFDENCKFIGIGKGKTRQTKKNAKKEIKCALDSYIELVKKLKNLGVYDNTLIIFTSDHGYGPNINSVKQTYKEKPYFANTTNEIIAFSASQYNAHIFYKNFKKKGDLIIKEEPRSLLDIRATLCKYFTACDPAQLDGISLDEDITYDRERTILVYNGKRKDFKEHKYNIKYFREISFKGHFTDLPIQMIKKKLEIGDKLNFTSRSVPILIQGLSMRRDFSITNNKTAVIMLDFSDSIKQSGATLALDIPRAYVSKKHPELIVDFFFNDVHLATETFSYFSKDSYQNRQILLNITPAKIQQVRSLQSLRLEIDNLTQSPDLPDGKVEPGIQLSSIELLNLALG